MLVLTDLLLQSQEVTVPSQTQGQFWFAVAVLVLFAGGSLVLWYRTDFSGLPKDQQEVKSALREQHHGLSPVSLRIPATEDVRDYRDDISRLVEAVNGESDGSNPTSPDRMTVPRALSEARSEVSSAWDPILGRVPKRSKQAVELGILLAVFGAIAVSTSRVVAWLQGGSGFPSPQVILSKAVALTQSVLATGVDVVFTNPHAELVWQLGFSYSILLFEVLYNNWQATSVLVITGGLVLAVLDWRAQGRDDEPLYDRRGAVLSVVGTAAVMWVAGTLPAALGAVTGARTVGALAGLLLATVVFLVAFAGAVAGLMQDTLIAAGAGVRFQRVARFRPGAVLRETVGVALGLRTQQNGLPDVSDGRSADWPLVGSILLRRALSLVEGLLAVILVAYLIVAVAEGRLSRVLTAVANAPADRKALLGIVVAIVVGVVAVQARAAWPDIKTALAESFARQRVRVALLGRGVPYAGVIAAYVVGYHLFRSIALGIAAAIGSGLALYALYVLLLKSRYQLSLIGGEERLPSETLIQMYPQLTDPDGDRWYYAVINGSTRVMWPDREVTVEYEEDVAEDANTPSGTFVDYVVDAAEDASTPGETPCSLATWHADDAFQWGIADVNETEQRIKEKVRKHTAQPLRENNRATRESQVLDELDEFPDHIREERWRQWFIDGILRREGDLLVLERDPWNQNTP